MPKKDKPKGPRYDRWIAHFKKDDDTGVAIDAQIRPFGYSRADFLRVVENYLMRDVIRHIQDEIQEELDTWRQSS